MHIDWKSVILGIILVMFVWPFLSGMLNKSKANTQRTA